MLATTLVIVSFFSLLFSGTHGHGFLCDPPSRNAAWRCGFPQDTPKNYDEMAMNAGGISIMYPRYPNPDPKLYGVCGDPWNVYPQPHAAGGVHDRGVRKMYTQGQNITLQVNVTAYHRGHFDFQLCDHYPETEDCFRTFVSNFSIEGFREGGAPTFWIHAPLPRNLTCDHCVLRWYWTTNNSPGLPPETFLNCADISIL